MDVVIALVPTIGVVALFGLVLRMIFRADSKERAELRKLEREYDESARDTTAIRR